MARDLQWGLGYPGGGNTLQALKALCAADQSAQSRSMHAHLKRFEQVQEAFPKKDQRVLPYVSAGNTPYPNTDPSVGLRSVARMVEARLGLQFAYLHQRLSEHLLSVQSDFVFFQADTHGYPSRLDPPMQTANPA